MDSRSSMRRQARAALRPLQAVEPNTVRSEISDTRRYNRHRLLLGFDHRKHRLHQVELTIDSRKEAGVLAHARNRCRGGRRALPVKQNESLLRQICNPYPLGPYGS